MPLALLVTLLTATITITQTLPECRADAGCLIVQAEVADATRGEVGCSLFRGPEGFPLDPTVARVIWQPAAPSLVCRFDDLPEGEYAVAISHDLNGNRRVDRNLLGMPREAWGVSNNVRPRLRAPRFDEARVRIATGEHASIAIEVRK